MLAIWGHHYYGRHVFSNGDLRDAAFVLIPLVGWGLGSFCAFMAQLEDKEEDSLAFKAFLAVLYMLFTGGVIFVEWLFLALTGMRC